MALVLIVNADDFGITRGANESIVAAHVAGDVTSTTLMANMPAVEHAAQLARAHPQLGVGMHFNLTLGAPLAGVAAAALTGADGQFLARGALLRKLALGGVPAAAIRAECAAQLAHLDALGVAPTHFDSHQHVHAMPQVFAALAATAAQRGVPVRIPWPWRGRVAGKSVGRKVSEAGLGFLTRQCRRRLPAGVRTNDGFCSVFDLQRDPRALAPADYAELLAPYRDGVVELMVHPAVVDDELRTRTAITDVSAAEDKLLRSGFLAGLVAARGGRLATYRDAF